MTDIVMVFDILGYLQFIERNPNFETFKEVVDIVESAPSKAQHKIFEILALSQGSANPIQSRLLESLEVRVVSDMVVCALNCDGAARVDADMRWLFMLCLAAEISVSLFNEGLPVRGAICEGEIIHYRSGIGGLGLASAYQCLGQLEFAGVVLTDEAVRALELATAHFSPYAVALNILAPRYNCPLKMDRARTYRTINLRNADLASANPGMSSDEMVRSAFGKRGKLITPEVEPKVRNTANFLDFLARPSSSDA